MAAEIDYYSIYLCAYSRYRSQHVYYKDFLKANALAMAREAAKYIEPKAEPEPEHVESKTEHIAPKPEHGIDYTIEAHRVPRFVAYRRAERGQRWQQLKEDADK